MAGCCPEVFVSPACISRGEVTPPMLEPILNIWWPWMGVGMIRGGDIIPEMGWGWGLITPGMGWKPMAELVMGVKSEVCFLGDAGPWLGFGLPPPWINVTN